MAIDAQRLRAKSGRRWEHFFTTSPKYGQSCPVPLAFHPRFISENSPTLERWHRPIHCVVSPEGRAELARNWSAVPSGLNPVGRTLPSVETLGYCRVSLRDNGLFGRRGGAGPPKPSD